MELLSKSYFTLFGHAITGVNLIWAAIFLLAGIIGGIWVAMVVHRRIGWAGRKTTGMIIHVARAKVFGVGAIAALAALGLPILNLIWIVLGVAAVAMLGLHRPLTQLYAGMLLLCDHPFDLDEKISVGDFEGTVEQVGLRATVLRSVDHVPVVVPNLYLMNNIITNWSRVDGGVRVRIPVEVAFGADSNNVITILRKAAERNTRVRKSPSPMAFMAGFGERGARYELLAFVDNHAEIPWATNELCRAIDSDFGRANIAMAAAVQAAPTGTRMPRPRSNDSDSDSGPRRSRNDSDRDSRPPRSSSPPPSRRSAPEPKPADLEVTTPDVVLATVAEVKPAVVEEKPVPPSEGPTYEPEAPAEEEPEETSVAEEPVEAPPVVQEPEPEPEPEPVAASYGRSKRKATRR
jgi:small-conductance mechanosensitive channel